MQGKGNISVERHLLHRLRHNGRYKIPVNSAENSCYSMMKWSSLWIWSNLPHQRPDPSLASVAEHRQRMNPKQVFYFRWQQTHSWATQQWPYDSKLEQSNHVVAERGKWIRGKSTETEKVIHEERIIIWSGESLKLWKKYGKRKDQCLMKQNKMTASIAFGPFTFPAQFFTFLSDANKKKT